MQAAPHGLRQVMGHGGDEVGTGNNALQAVSNR